MRSPRGAGFELDQELDVLLVADLDVAARDGLPAVPGPRGQRVHPLRRQLEPDPGQRDLRQLALRRTAVLGAGRGPR